MQLFGTWTQNGTEEFSAKGHWWWGCLEMVLEEAPGASGYYYYRPYVYMRQNTAIAALHPQKGDVLRLGVTRVEVHPQNDLWYRAFGVRSARRLPVTASLDEPAWYRCHTHEEIAEAVGYARRTITEFLESLQSFGNGTGAVSEHLLENQPLTLEAPQQFEEEEEDDTNSLGTYTLDRRLLMKANHLDDQYKPPRVLWTVTSPYSDGKKSRTMTAADTGFLTDPITTGYPRALPEDSSHTTERHHHGTEQTRPLECARSGRRRTASEREATLPPC